MRPTTTAGRLARIGVVLITLGVLAYASTYGPWGTLTSVALSAMAAYALSVLGGVALLTALALILRR